MSGTSADGIDVALVRLYGRGLRTRLQLLAHKNTPYPAALRRTVLELMNSRHAAVADLARLNFLLAELYAEAAQAAQKHARVRCRLVGCHGQTLYHQDVAVPYLGRRFATTWQTGDGSLLAARLGVPVVSDFRPADMAAGGTGAPLVPYLDYLFFRHPRHGRIVQNIGGIGNLTAIPARARPQDVVAFDTGPGNMVIDAVTGQLFGKPYDALGAYAARGKVLQPVLRQLLRASFFRRKGPRSAGREQFGREFVQRFLRLCKGADKYDVLATATALTARSIGLAVREVALPRQARVIADFLVSGGGARNPTLMGMLRAELEPLGCGSATDDFGLPAEPKKPWPSPCWRTRPGDRTPSNLPSATGACRHPRQSYLGEDHRMYSSRLLLVARPVRSAPALIRLRAATPTPTRLSCSSRAAQPTWTRASAPTPSPSAWTSSSSMPCVSRDEHFQLQPWLAERWEIPDPLTYIFHLRSGVSFHDGRPLTAAMSTGR